MEPCFSVSSSFEVSHGDYFSVFVQGDSYWVASNDFRSVIKGPYDKADALKIMKFANEYAGVYFI